MTHAMNTSMERLEPRRMFDGTVDLAWGDNGVVTAPFGGGGVDNIEFSSIGKVSAIGRAVRGFGGDAHTYGHNGIGETTFWLSGGGTGSNLSLLHSNGEYITTALDGVYRFIPQGESTVRFSGGRLSPVPTEREVLHRDLIIAPNGDVVVSGVVGLYLTSVGEQQVDWAGFEVYSAIGVFKYGVEFPIGYQLAALAEGRILAAGNGKVGCYLPNGTLDPNFGAAGVASVTETPIEDITLDRWGRVYVCWSYGGNQSLTRLRPNGARDKTFGTNGSVHASNLNLGGAAGMPGVEKFGVTRDGMVYVAAMIAVGGDHRLAVGRFDANGVKDTTWGANGVAQVDMTEGNQVGGEVREVLVLPDGDVVVAAVDRDPQSSGADSKLARFNGPDAAASAPQVTLGAGKLTIVGTAGADTVVFQSTNDFGINVTLNGVLHSYGELEVRSVSVLGGGGNDYIDARAMTNLPPVSGTDHPVTIDGGDGNDVIVGHQGRDRITGGNDDDRIHGWTGDDWVSGNAQKDRVIGGAGHDIIHGNGGRDFLVGEDGNDSMSGGDQPDTLLGMAGDDSMIGAGGHDRLDGGDGADFMYGVGGNDTFIARDGAVDTLVGGVAATDRALIDDEDELSGIEELLA
jgi:Ca2+-binding RTX toxin-like protein